MGKTKKKDGRQQAPTSPAPLNPTDNTCPIFLAAALCFFLSGAAGLGYQVLWVRMLDKVIGSAPFAVATVISVVMTGLALGSRLAGKSADRLLSRGALLALCGKLEVAIGLLALAIPLGHPLYQALYDRLLDYPWCYQMAIFVGCANVPVFNLLPWDKLDTRQQTRYRQTVLDYCRRVLVPSYSLIGDPFLKGGCAKVQMQAIRGKIAGDDSHPIDHHNLALAQTALGDFDGAMSSLHQTLSLAPDHKPTLIALGLLLAEDKKFAEAEGVLKKASVLAPDNAAIRKYLGMVYLRRGKTESTIAELQTAQNLASDDPTILAELSAALRLGARTRSAVEP